MEPERKIEKLLRAYAKKRREDAGDPLKLHPANRRILQGEAGRRTPAPGERDGGNLFLLFLAVFRRRLVFVLPVIVIAFLAFMYLPALNSAKQRAQSLGAVRNLREIGMATRRYAEDNKDVLPASLDEVTNELGASKVLIDPATGKPFVYAVGGKRLDSLQSNTVLAYSLAGEKDHAVLFADGRVETVTGTRLAELTNQKPVELALADKSTRERLAETPPPAAPVATVAPPLPPPNPEKLKINLAREESKAGDLGVNAPSEGEPTKRQPEIAQSEPVAMPAPIGAGATSFVSGEQMIAANGSISGKLPALESSDALAQNRPFNRLVAQTNSGQFVLTASQNFVQAGVSSGQDLFKSYAVSTQATSVLQSFQVQQNGNTLSVVDRDGSVYNGSVQPEKKIVRNQQVPVQTPPGAVALRQARAASPADNQQQPAQNYFFRVAGMNRTLKQNVVFTGNLLANNAVPQTAQTSNFLGAVGGGGGGGTAGQIQQAAANQSQQNLLSNSRIVGTAVIDRTNQIEINAIPVTQ
jgi:hypothetical protein